MKKTVRNISFTLIGIVVVFLVGFYLWAVIPYYVMDEAVQKMKTNELVTVNNDDNIYFEPEDYNDELKGLIIYPGTRVDSEAYAPLAMDIAKEGNLVVIAHMPLDLSVLDIDRAGEIINKYPEIEKWVISGHSMGGAMAAFFSDKNRDLIDGLVFFGSYPSKDTNISDSDIKVMSIYGENDLVSDIEEVEEKKSNLPENTEYVMIEGGNHAMFGWYGEQKGDGEAEITYEEQHEIIVKSLLKFIGKL